MKGHVLSAAIAVAIVLVVIFFTVAVYLTRQPAAKVPPPPAATTLACVTDYDCMSIESRLNPHAWQTLSCEEDMPCWDCTVMGNRRCGP